MNILNLLILDISDSMNTPLGDTIRNSRLDVAKKVVTEELSQFLDSDFGLLAFNSEPIILFKGHFSEENRQEIKGRTITLKARGSTNLANALLASTSMYRFSTYDSVRILIVTDGEDETDEAEDISRFLAEKYPHISISIVLIKPERSAIDFANRVSMNGEVRIVSSLDEFESQFNDAIKINVRNTVLTIDNKIQLLDDEIEILIKEKEKILTQYPDLDTAIDESLYPVKLELNGGDDSPLTVEYLRKEIIPFLYAIEDFQLAINEINGVVIPIRIISITKFSPVQASVQGIAQAFETIERIIMPWKRKHAKEMAALERREKETEVKRLENDLRITEEHDNELRLHEIERAKLENEQLRVKLERERTGLTKEKISLLRELLDEIAPSKTEEEKIAYMMRLLPTLDKLLSSPFDFDNDKYIKQ